MDGTNDLRVDPPKALRAALAVCRRTLVAATGFSLAINLLMLAVPLYTLQLYDRVLPSRNLDTLGMLSLITLAALAALGALEAVRGSLFARLTARVERTLGSALMAVGVTGRLAEPDGIRDPLRDLAPIRGFLTGPALRAILDAPWTPVFVAAVFLVHPWLGWVTLGGVAILFVLAVANELASRGVAQQADEATRTTSRAVEDAARNADVVQAMGMLPAVTLRFQRSQAETLRLQARADARRVAFGGMSRFVRLSLQAGVLGAGAYLAVAGQMTPGGIIAASILAGRALAPVDVAIASWRAMLGARAAYRRIRRRLKQADFRAEAMSLPQPSGKLQVEALTYAHPGARDWALRAISFALEAGEVLGVVGPSAAGKTTLARLLVGNQVPAAGGVRLDGVEMSGWRPEERGRHVGYLPQSVELFAGTVRENIARMGAGESTAVVRAARLVGAHEMILALPEGYETQIGDGGCILSGGQRQWIGLARAAYGDPCLVVLDEPNSNLDGEGEQAAVAAIEAMKQRGATVVVIAHRANVLQKTDKILVMSEGKAELFGERTEVMQTLMRRSVERRAEVAHG